MVDELALVDAFEDRVELLLGLQDELLVPGAALEGLDQGRVLFDLKVLRIPHLNGLRLVYALKQIHVLLRIYLREVDDHPQRLPQPRIPMVQHLLLQRFPLDRTNRIVIAAILAEEAT